MRRAISMARPPLAVLSMPERCSSLIRPAKRPCCTASPAGQTGGDPWAGLVRDPAGNLYGTSYLGGDFTCNCGTVFKLDSVGNYMLLHTFTGPPDGAFSFASLIRDRAGNLSGTTA